MQCTLEECGVAVSTRLVKSAENKADKMTRVLVLWHEKPVCMSAVSSEASRWAELKKVHDETHFGVDRTLYIVKQCRPELSASRDEVKKIVDACFQCKSIDPAPVRWHKGELSVENNWNRVACDITHFSGTAYLTMIDCGPSRFAVWKAISSEMLLEISGKLLEVFRERGPPEQLLLDNATVFKSRRFVDVCERWSVSVIYRAAYRPSGNGIIEHHHRTIKRMAARTGQHILDMVFWYNFAPLSGEDESGSPHAAIHSYKVRCPLNRRSSPKDNRVQTSLRKGQRVLTKPRDCRCTTPWSVRTISAITGDGAVEVDGVHRHAADIRLVANSASSQSEESNSSGDDEEEEVDQGRGLRRSQRVRGQPWRYDAMDYGCAACDLAIKGRCDCDELLADNVCALLCTEAGVSDCSAWGLRPTT